MEWLEITKAIGELGILIVIAGLFLFFYYKDKNARDTEFKQLFNAVVNKGTHILTEDEDRLAKQIDQSITSYMKDIVNTLQPSKCFLVRYHNGGKDMNGLSFLKLSVTNEAGAGGLAPVIQEYQNQFRSSIGGICHAIDKQGYVFVPNLEEIKETDIGTYDLMTAKDTRSAYCHAITNATGYVIGFLAITYRNDNKTQEDVAKIKDLLETRANQISTLLDIRVD